MKESILRVRKIAFFGAFLILVLFFVGTAVGADLTSIDTLLAHGEAEKALQKLQDETGAAGDDEAILWRKARGHYELGRISENAQERADHLGRAEGLARQAIEVNPQSDEGYKWLAIALGAQAEDADVETQIRLSRRIKENIEKALALDPDDDISLLVLSRWHYKVASLGFWSRTIVRLVYGGLPDASFEKAEALLWQAIAEKDRIAHRYSLAKVYDRMGRRAAAIAQLRLALRLPVTFPEEAEDLEKARRKLENWQ